MLEQLKAAESRLSETIRSATRGVNQIGTGRSALDELKAACEAARARLQGQADEARQLLASLEAGLSVAADTLAADLAKPAATPKRSGPDEKAGKPDTSPTAERRSADTSPTVQGRPADTSPTIEPCPVAEGLTEDELAPSPAFDTPKPSEARLAAVRQELLAWGTGDGVQTREEVIRGALPPGPPVAPAGGTKSCGAGAQPCGAGAKPCGADAPSGNGRPKGRKRRPS